MSICRWACRTTAGLNIRSMSRFTSFTYRADSRSASISMADKFGRSSHSDPPMWRSKMSEVECAGSVDTSRTRLPRRLAASANAAEQVVLPTPPLPPKNTT